MAEQVTHGRGIMVHHNSARILPLRRIALASALALAGASTPALAEVGNAEAADLSISLSILGLPALNVSAQAPVNITDATAPADDANQLPTIDIGNALIARITTGLLESEAEYRPGVSTSAIAAKTQASGLNLSALGLLGASLLSLQADAIGSKSLVVGHCPLPPPGPSLNGLLDDLVYGNGFDEGNFGTGGDGTPGTGPDDTATLANVHLSILGIDVPLPLNPPPNTGVDLNALGIAGATLLLNEQVLGGDGITARSKTSNALRLSLNILGTITGDVVIGHSSASIDCTQ